MTRFRLIDNILKIRTEENKMRYTKQRNLPLLRTTKKKNYGDLDEKKVIDSKQLWKTIKPLILDKSAPKGRINLVEKKKK